MPSSRQKVYIYIDNDSDIPIPEDTPLCSESSQLPAVIDTGSDSCVTSCAFDMHETMRDSISPCPSNIPLTRNVVGFTLAAVYPHASDVAQHGHGDHADTLTERAGGATQGLQTRNICRNHPSQFLCRPAQYSVASAHRST